MTQLSLSTMHAENELLSSNRIKGLVVSVVSILIKLPTSYSCTTIPAKRRQIPCPEMTKEWPHHKPIAPHLMHLQRDVEVGLLIGANCPQAIVPREFIPGQRNEPYAQRTDLGWGIIGNVSQPNSTEDGNPEAIVHRVTTCNVTINVSLQKNCYFVVKPTVKEVVNSAQLRQMLELDFSEARTPGPTMSQDDRKFLLKMEQGAYQGTDGHYVMPLPFREVTPTMPNNKSLALHRLNKLRTRLEKDESTGRTIRRL